MADCTGPLANVGILLKADKTVTSCSCLKVVLQAIIVNLEKPGQLSECYCIFTAISISLSLGWRQRGHLYAIRAGRNLPDKEFRYLRTVIVTAAVYRGFDQELRVTSNPIN